MLQKPGFQMFDVHGRQSSYTPYRIFSKGPSWPTMPLQYSDNRDCAFHILLELGFEKHHVQPFLDLADFSIILEAYHSGILPKPNIPEIATNRNIVHHQLLSLPKMSELDEETKKENSLVYEACRLTALLYAVMVTFPIPRSNGVRQTLLQNLQEVLTSIGMAEERKEVLEVYLWCLVLGGIASLGHDKLTWYTEKTRLVASHLELDSWKDAEATLKDFAWLRSACNPGGMSFWAMAMGEKDLRRTQHMALKSSTHLGKFS
jgi:hypothetical protein